MHTLNTKGCVFHYHSDLSEVRIHLKDPAGRTKDAPDIIMDGEDLIDLVALYVQGERISAMEQAVPREILGIPKRH